MDALTDKVAERSSETDDLLAQVTVLALPEAWRFQGTDSRLQAPSLTLATCRHHGNRTLTFRQRLSSASVCSCCQLCHRRSARAACSSQEHKRLHRQGPLHPRMHRVRRQMSWLLLSRMQHIMHPVRRSASSPCGSSGRRRCLCHPFCCLCHPFCLLHPWLMSLHPLTKSCSPPAHSCHGLGRSQLLASQPMEHGAPWQSQRCSLQPQMHRQEAAWQRA